MGVWKAYRSLNAEQRRVLKTKQITMNRTIDGVIGLLQPIAAYDRVGDKARTAFGCGIGIGILLVVITIIATANDAFPSRAVGIAAIVILALLTISSMVAYGWSKGIDVSNNLRQFVLPVMGLFREDIDPKARVNMKLDLSAPTAKQKLQQESAPYARGAYYKIIEKFYIDPWATAKMPLADGSTLSWSITDHIRERIQTKKNPRGKIKTKTKYTIKTHVDVELTLRSDAYSVAAVQGERVKAGEKKKAIHIKGRHKRASLSLEPLDPVVFIDMVAGIYRRATPAQ